MIHKHKICYVCTIPATIKSFFLPQLKFLAQNGFDVTVICSPDNSLKALLEPEVRFLPVNIPRGISIFGSFSASCALIKIFRREKFEMVQYSTPNAAFYASFAAKFTHVPVRNYHLMGLRYLGAEGAGRFFLKTIEKFTCNNSTSVECVSKSNLEYCVKEKLFSLDKACVIWNGSSGGIDLRRFDVKNRERWRSELRRDLGYGENDFIFGFVGRITHDKGINKLIKAYLPLSEMSKLILIGYDEGRNTLNRELLKKAEDSSTILYHEKVSDIERYYAMIDVLILPSYREGFGNVVIEAAALGTPAILSDIPGLIDTAIDNKTAFYVHPKNSESLYDAMKFCLDHKDILKSMKTACVKYACENFNQDILNQKILDRKNELLCQTK